MLKVIFSSFREKVIYIIFTLLFIFAYIIFDFLLLELNIYNKEISKITNTNSRSFIVMTNEYNDTEKLNKEEIKFFHPIYNNEIININGIVYSVNYDYDIVINKGEIILTEKAASKLDYDKIKNTIELKINDISNTYFISSKTDKYKADIYMNLEDFQNTFNAGTKMFHVVIKDNYPPEEFIENILKEKLPIGYYDDEWQNKVKQLENAKNIYLILIIIVSLMLIFFVNYIIKNIIIKEKKDIAILKAVGYKKRLITLIIFLRILLIVIVSLIISTFLNLIYCIINSYSIINIFKIKSLTTLIITIIIFINLIKCNTMIKKMNVFIALQE